MHTASVTVASNDTFAFRPDLGAGLFANTGSAGPIELNQHSSFTDSQFAALLHETLTGQPELPFQWASDGRDTVINPGNHDGITQVNVHVADLHASAVFVH